MRTLASTTFYLPYAMLIVSALGAAISYIRPIAPRIHPAPGFAGLAALMLCTLFFGTWGSEVRTPDLQQFAIGGFVPQNDAGFYYTGTFEIGYTGHWGWASSTRPLAAAFRDVITGLAGIDYRLSIVIQTFLFSAALSFAAWRIALWIGPWAALAFVALIIITYRPYLGTAMTEPLGMIWSLLAVAFLADALRTRTFPPALLAIACASAAQMTRTGAILVVFALMAWAFVASFERRTAWRNLLLIGLAAGAPWVLSRMLGALYGAPTVESGWNVSYLLCTLARGTHWTECRDTLVATGFHPTNIGEFAPALSALAWQSFVADPWVLYNSLKANVDLITTFMPVFLLGHYNLPFQIPRWIANYTVAAALPGLAIHFWRAPKSEWLLWALLAVSIGVGAMFVWRYDGWRTLFATHAFVILLLVTSLRSGTPSMVPAINARAATIALGIAAIALAATPALLHRAMAAPPSDEYESRSIEGFLLIADDAPAPDAPFLRASRFADIVTQIRVEREYGNFVAPVTHVAPKAVFWATLRGQEGQTAPLFIGPPEVMTRRGVRAWRFVFSEPDWKTKNSPLRIVEQAEALP